MSVATKDGEEPGFFDKLFGGKKSETSDSKKKTTKKKK